MPARTPADEREFDERLATGKSRTRNVQRHTLKSLGIDVTTTGKTVDRAWLPLAAGEAGEPVLDVARLSEELARGDRPMSAIAVSPRAACAMHDMGLHEKHRASDPTADAASVVRDLSGRLARGDYGKLLAGGFRALEGHLVPLFGQLKPKADSGAGKRCRRGDTEPPHPAKTHPLLFRPGAIMTTVSTDTEDSGHVLALCLIVSPRTFNYPEDHPDRVSFHAAPAFEECVTYLYVVRAYDPPISLRALGPPAILGTSNGVKSLGPPAAGRNEYEHVFGWAAHIQARIAVDPTDDFRDAARSGFHDLKMSRESVRRFMPWDIAAAHGRVENLRRAGTLDRELAYRAMPSSKKCKMGDFGGANLRRALLTELLLRGTPLEPLLRGTAHARDFALRACVVPGGAEGLHARMKGFLAASRG